jgi:copper(I)-binding protein
MAALLSLAACERAQLAPLVVSDLEIYSPLPGSHAAVAYFTLRNRSDAGLVIRAINSLQFARVEIHETILENGIARMRQLDKVSIEANSEIEFAAGGKHLMLMQARGDQGENAPVTLEIHYEPDGMLIIETTLRSRAGT